MIISTLCYIDILPYQGLTNIVKPGERLQPENTHITTKTSPLKRDNRSVKLISFDTAYITLTSRQVPPYFGPGHGTEFIRK